MWHSREVLSVDGPVVVGLDGERSSDEAVSLTLRYQRAQRLGIGSGLDGHVEIGADLDEREAPVLLALRNDPVCPAARDRLVAGPARVIAEAREDAAAKPGEDEVLGRPPLLLALERGVGKRARRRPGGVER